MALISSRSNTLKNLEALFLKFGFTYLFMRGGFTIIYVNQKTKFSVTNANVEHVLKNNLDRSETITYFFHATKENYQNRNKPCQQN